jgi:hypothetical protein
MTAVIGEELKQAPQLTTLGLVRYYFTRLSSPNMADKAALLTFPNKTDFVQARIHVLQPAVISLYSIF